MDKTQKVIVVLLIMAILFSGISIFTSLAAFKIIELPKSSGVSANAVQNPTVSLFVERNNISGGGGG